jgi:hypothetical protein
VTAVARPAAVMHPNGAYALSYAALGYRVGPLWDPITENPHGKAPVGPLTPRGCHAFTTDSALIIRWWSMANWNIGLAVPPPVLILDADGPNRNPPSKGMEGLTCIQEDYTQLPPTLEQFTGSGGRHLWFRRPSGVLTKENLKPYELDFKVHGGYVVMAPSTHPDSGIVYRLIDRPIAEPSRWLAALVVKRPAAARQASTPKQPAIAGAWSWTGGPIGDTIAAFNAAASWHEILTGWTCVKYDGDSPGSLWKHPTASSPISARINEDHRLYVFSPNTPFEQTVAHTVDKHGYDKFDAYACLHHRGSNRAAADDIATRTT